MKKVLFVSALVLLAWSLLHRPMKPQWQGPLAPNDPEQTSEDLPPPWGYKDFTVTPKAKYHIKAVVLSKRRYRDYWAWNKEDALAPYDLALGWGAMSDARILSQLKISQSWRWYEYRWAKQPPIDPSEIMTHSSNNHLVPADGNVLQDIEHIKKYDIVQLDGYLVDIRSRRQDWSWESSLVRRDTGDGSCELIWVDRVADYSDFTSITKR